MKIAYCIPSLYIPGGMERVLTIKANYFADVLGLDVTIIMTDGGLKPPYYDLSPKVNLIQLHVNFEQLWTLPLYKKAFMYLRKQRIYKKKLTECLMQIKPDITVSMLRREINFICDIADGSLKIGEIHINRDNFRDLDGRDHNLIKKTLSDLWMRQLVRQLKRLDLFVCLTNEDKAKWSELQNVTVVPNPLSFTSKAYSTCNEKKVIAVGRYVPQKGFDLLIKAWSIVAKKHEDWSLSIYGKGDRTLYSNLAKEYHVEDSCYLNGPESNIASKYIESSIFVLSSRFEGFGVVLLEAMACGVPAVSFACPCGPRDIIDDGVNGLLVKTGDIEQLSQKINYLIESGDARKAMGINAIKSVEKYSIDQIAQQWKTIFEKVLKK